MTWDVWQVSRESEELLGMLCDWHTACRLVAGITGYDYDIVADYSTQYEQEFSLQWYEVELEVRKAWR